MFCTAPSSSVFFIFFSNFFQLKKFSSFLTGVLTNTRLPCYKPTAPPETAPSHKRRPGRKSAGHPRCEFTSRGSWPQRESEVAARGEYVGFPIRHPHPSHILLPSPSQPRLPAFISKHTIAQSNVLTRGQVTPAHRFPVRSTRVPDSHDSGHSRSRVSACSPSHRQSPITAVHSPAHAGPDKVHATMSAPAQSPFGPPTQTPHPPFGHQTPRPSITHPTFSAQFASAGPVLSNCPWRLAACARPRCMIASTPKSRIHVCMLSLILAFAANPLLECHRTTRIYPARFFCSICFVSPPTCFSVDSYPPSEFSSCHILTSGLTVHVYIVQPDVDFDRRWTSVKGSQDLSVLSSTFSFSFVTRPLFPPGALR